MGEDLASLRKEYTRGGLVEADLPADPISLASRWVEEAVRAGLYDPTAMVLATVGSDGAPSSRMVLLKGVDDRGLAFFTNLGSRKARELAADPRCALLFPWHPLERQLRVEGTASLVPRPEVERYFASRPRASRLGAWASRQSMVVSGREELTEEYAAREAQFRDEVPTPGFWGGYVVRPQVFEFWQGRPGRMHDRLVYRRTEQGWVTHRLAP